jgi:hypothetical protein
MRNFYLFILLSFYSCVSPKKFNTAQYSQYANNHQKIVILPVNVEGRYLDDRLSQEVKNELILKEQYFIQNLLYQQISLRSGSEKNDIVIQVVSPSSSNNLLIEKGIDILNIKNISNADLARMLDVDAVIRTTVNCKAMLHSTEKDLLSEAFEVVSILHPNPILYHVGQVSLHSVFTSAEIIDLKHDATIWSYSRKDEIKLRAKNTNVLTRIVRKISNRFPYRKGK